MNDETPNNDELDFDNAYVGRAVATRERMKKADDHRAMIKELRKRLDEMDDKRVVIIELLRMQENQLADLTCEEPEE